MGYRAPGQGTPTGWEKIDETAPHARPSSREQRFLLDLIAQEEPGALANHPMPELYALLRAIERMWGGESAKRLTAPPGLLYYLMAYHHIQMQRNEKQGRQ
jgi:hypothetical protein